MEGVVKLSGDRWPSGVGSENYVTDVVGTHWRPLPGWRTNDARSATCAVWLLGDGLDPSGDFGRPRVR